MIKKIILALLVFLFLFSYGKGKIPQPKKDLNTVSKEYDRKNWGSWIDEDSDCQDTRHEILIKYSLIPVKFKTSKQCQVVEGKWYDPYTDTFYFHAKDLDIDHIVPVYEAFLSGGSHWDREQKIFFFNDRDNLLPVYAPTNKSKGKKDIAEWLPSNKNFVCNYISRWIIIKNRYQLEIDDDEMKTINQNEKNCLANISTNS